jgi:hypothetical protein
MPSSQMVPMPSLMHPEHARQVTPPRPQAVFENTPETQTPPLMQPVQHAPLRHVPEVHAVPLTLSAPSLQTHVELVVSHAVTPLAHAAFGFVVHAAPTAHAMQVPVVLQYPPEHATFVVVRAQPAVSLSMRFAPLQVLEPHV